MAKTPAGAGRGQRPMTGGPHAEVSMETTHIDWHGNEGVTVNSEVVQVPVEPTDKSKLLGSTEGVAIGMWIISGLPTSRRG